MRRARRSACIAAAAAVAALAAPARQYIAQDAAPQDDSVGRIDVVAQLPRTFGYVVGDLVTQRAPLRVEGRDLTPAALPQPQRVSVWFERRDARIETRTDGERWLAVEYQIINSPESLTTVELPAWELAATDGRRLAIAAQAVSIAPLTPPSASEASGFGTLRPDRPAPAVATALLRRGLWLWSVACLVTIGAWIAWFAWRNWRDASTRPFARALRELRELDDEQPEAWLSLHRAFDATAGRVVRAEALPQLFERAPHLEPLRPAIERFFVQSAERFFGAGLTGEPVSVRALCRDLRRIEKRRER